MSNIKIMVDSGSDIPRDFATENDISVIPLTISFGLEQFQDYYDMTSKQFFDKMRTTDKLPTTSQPNPYTFIDYFEKCEGIYDHIICITMSSHGSGTHASALMAKKEYSENNCHHTNVHIFDSWQCSMGLTLLASKAVNMIKESLGIDAILDKLEEMKTRLATYIIPENLEYLHKGGHVNTVTSILGSLLDMRPIITVYEGWGRNYGKVRGARQAQQKLIDLFDQQHSENEIWVSYADCYDRAVELVNELKKKFVGIKITLNEMSSTMGTHAGPGSIGIHFLRTAVHSMA